MSLAWGTKVSAEFRARTLLIARVIGCDPSWLMAIMYFESRLDPAAVNAASGASGLIQAIRSTAAGLGYTLEQIRAMPAEEQLEKIVRPYFLPFAGRLRTLSDAYMAVLWPVAVGKPEDHVLFAAGTKAYDQNRALDVDGDGKITKAEATAFVVKALNQGMQPANATMDDRERHQPEAPMPAKSDLLAVLGGIASAINPAAGILLNAFAPLVKEKIAKEVDRHAEQPGVGQAVAEALTAAIVDKAKQVTGRTDDLEAVAVAVQPQNAAKLQEVEAVAVASVAQRMQELAPLLDKSIEWDKAKWQAEREGKQTVSTIAIEEKKAGLWDMTRALVMDAIVSNTAIGLMLTTAIVYQSFRAEKGIDPVLLALAGPLLMQIVSKIKDIIAYRFDGTKESSAQTQAVLNMSQQGTKP